MHSNCNLFPGTLSAPTVSSHLSACKGHRYLHVRCMWKVWSGRSVPHCHLLSADIHKHDNARTHSLSRCPFHFSHTLTSPRMYSTHSSSTRLTSVSNPFSFPSTVLVPCAQAPGVREADIHRTKSIKTDVHKKRVRKVKLFQ